MKPVQVFRKSGYHHFESRPDIPAAIYVSSYHTAFFLMTASLYLTALALHSIPFPSLSSPPPPSPVFPPDCDCLPV